MGTLGKPIVAVASATVRRQSYVLDVTDFPVATDKDGNRFSPDRVRVEISRGVHENPDVDPEVCSDTYATVSLHGPDEGWGYQRTATFMLAGRCAVDYPPAPDWLRAVLRHAGVTP